MHVASIRRSHNGSCYRLMRQVNESQHIMYDDIDVPKIRKKSYKEQVIPMIFWENFERSHTQTRNWKDHRRTQHKIIGV